MAGDIANAKLVNDSITINGTEVELGGSITITQSSDTTYDLSVQAGATNTSIIRLAGTNVEEGKQILRDSGLKIIPADDLDDAAMKIVNAVKGD